MRKLMLPLLALALALLLAPNAGAVVHVSPDGQVSYDVWELIDSGTDTAIGNGYLTGTKGVVTGSTPFASNPWTALRFEAFFTSLTNDGSSATYQVNLDGYDPSGDVLQGGGAGASTNLTIAATGSSLILWTAQVGAVQTQTTVGPPQQVESSTWRNSYAGTALHLFKTHITAVSIKWDLYGHR
jgi:hypothetical protein